MTMDYCKSCARMRSLDMHDLSCAQRRCGAGAEGSEGCSDGGHSISIRRKASLSKPQFLQLGLVMCIISCACVESFVRKRFMPLKNVPCKNPTDAWLYGPSLQNRYASKVKENKGFQQYQKDYVARRVRGILPDNKTCPCMSKRPFGDCCGWVHREYRYRGSDEISPDAMMRARYTAYKIGNFSFIIDMSSRDCAEFKKYMLWTFINGRRRWEKHITALSKYYRYYGLEMLNTTMTPDNQTAQVACKLLVRDQGSEVQALGELGTFVVLDGRWKYRGSSVMQLSYPDKIELSRMWNLTLQDFHYDRKYNIKRNVTIDFDDIQAAVAPLPDDRLNHSSEVYLEAMKNREKQAKKSRFRAFLKNLRRYRLKRFRQQSRQEKLDKLKREEW